MQEQLSFEINSGKLHITDPILEYIPTNFFSLWDLPCLNGKWLVKLKESNEGEYWGNRITDLIVYHDSYDEYNTNYKEINKIKDIGTDTGKCGIYDSSIYPKKDESEKFNNLNSKLLDESFINVMEKGVICETGFGAGMYDINLKFEKKHLMYINIVFINDEIRNKIKK